MLTVVSAGGVHVINGVFPTADSTYGGVCRGHEELVHPPLLMMMSGLDFVMKRPRSPTPVYTSMSRAATEEAKKAATEGFKKVFKYSKGRSCRRRKLMSHFMPGIILFFLHQLPFRQRSCNEGDFYRSLGSIGSSW